MPDDINATSRKKTTMPTRRHFLGQSTTATAAFAFASCSGKKSSAAVMYHAPQPSAKPKKKGLGASLKIADWSERLKQVKARWVYTWNYQIPENKPLGVDFIPMVYRVGLKNQDLGTKLATLKQAGITELLGFNEPDAPSQGNMSVEESLAAWPILMESGLRLGSPSCVHPDKEWMIAFMEGVKKNKLRLDFVCVHSYGGTNPESLISRLEKVHQLFGCPVWITEFACGDWNAKTVESNRHKPEDVLRFMEKVLPMLEKLDYVERYAWFPAKPTSVPLGSSALFDEQGQLTRLGECYRDI
jgi:hypothetical protein